MLDISSTDKGMLVPRLTTTQRTNISNPATGLLVYDTDFNSFWYYANSTWNNLSNSTFADADNDTKIQVEENSDEDIIRFDMNGTEFLRLDSGRIEMVNTGESIFLGEGAGVNDDFSENRNIFIGDGSGSENTGGERNIFLGYESGHENTTGFSNIFLGYESGRENTTGVANAFLGYQSGYFSTTGNYNTFLGQESGYSGTTGSFNVFLGYRAGYNETGSNKLYIANSKTSSPLIYGEFDNRWIKINGQFSTTDTVTFSSALIVNGQDLANTAFISENGITHSINNSDDFTFGADSLNYGGSGDEYKFFFDKSRGAFRAGLIENTDWDESNLGKYSAAFGENGSVSGEYSFAGGAEHEVSGEYSAALGYANEVSAEYSFAVGADHVVNGDNSAAIGNSNEINSDFSFAVGDDNLVDGRYASALGRDLFAPSQAEVAIGIYNTSYTAESATTFNDLDRLFVIGNGTAQNSRSDAMIVYKSGNTEINGNVTVRDSLTINKESFFNEQVTINESQGGITFFPLVVSNDNNANNAFNNGIQIIAGQESAVINNEKLAYFLQFITPDGTEIGSIRQASGSDVSFNTTSDVRLKSNIQATNYGLQDILNIDVRDYHYTSDASETPRTGFLAQQLYEVFPMAVTKGGDDAKTNPWTVDYSKLTPLLVKGMQDQQVQIEELQVENEKLKAQVTKISQLEMMLHQLQAQINQEDSNTATIISEEK